MKTHKITIIILTLCLHTNLFADIAPNPIKAKSISPKEQTSIRMESEKVIIDLYNDSSVVKCLFNMKNLGEQEKLQIGFPEMTFHYHMQKSKVDEASRFQVKENGKVVNLDFSDSLKYNEEYRKKGESFKIKEEWYLWESEFQQGESKTIEVEYSLPFGMLYKTNERFFTYLLSTGANWKGTIGKAEIIVNLKDIEIDSLTSQQPNNCVIIKDQLKWIFSDFEPTTKDDIKINYKSSKILYAGKKPIPPVYIVDESLDEKFDLQSIDPNDIVRIEVIKNPKETMKYTNQNNGVVKIYTKYFVLTELKRLITAKLKEKIVLPEYDQLKENYCLFINEDEVDFTKIIGIKTKSVVKLEIIDSKDEKTKIMIELKK
ncbi:MAG: hypothetical protein PHX22_11765 [Dysgonamonadaceae bacterium]|nr:hypothetical protein [Dysgonamonadaceae bacterium]